MRERLRIPDNEFWHDMEYMPSMDTMYHNYLRLNVDEQTLNDVLQELRECERLVASTPEEHQLCENLLGVFRLRYAQRMERARKTEAESLRIQQEAEERLNRGPDS